MSTDPDWSLAEDDPRAFFGLAADATLTDLKRAYARLIKVWKPDKFPSEFKKIRRAFEELEHGFKLEAPPLDLAPVHFLGSQAAADPSPAPEGPTRLRPDFPSAPSFDWTARLHEIGVESTLAEMERLGRLEPRDWLLLAALREAQNNDDLAVFSRGVIEALRHHADDAELWHTLLLELRRSWAATELEVLCGELLTLHHHPDFLRRCHAFWMYAFEVAPAAKLCPLLDRFLHRAHGKAHQEEASFVLEVLMRFGPALPAEWIRLQTSFYEQIWGPSLQGFANDLDQFPRIRNELEKADDPAARRLLDFFAAWGRHDLPELHLSRFDLRHLLLQRPDTAKTLLPSPDLFLPASRLLSFRSRNLRGGQSIGSEAESVMGLRSAIADFLHYLTLVALPVVGVIFWILTMNFQSNDLLPVWIVVIALLWIYAAPLIVRRFKECWLETTILKLFGAFIFGCALLVGFFALHTIAILIWVLIFRNSERFRDWLQDLLPSLKLVGLAFAAVSVAYVNFIFLQNLSDKAHRFDHLELTVLSLLILCFAVNIRGLYDSFYTRFTRVFEKTFRETTKFRVLRSLSLHQVSLQLWHHKLTENQKKLTRALISDGDIHLAAAIWEAPKRKEED